MTESRHDHQKLLKETGKFRLSQEQEDTINRIMGDVTFEIEDDTEGESTLELPQLRKS